MKYKSLWGTACAQTIIDTVKDKLAVNESEENLPKIEASDASTLHKNTDLRLAIQLVLLL